MNFPRTIPLMFPPGRLGHRLPVIRQTIFRTSISFAVFREAETKDPPPGNSEAGPADAACG